MEKVGDKLIITMVVNHDIVDECFSYNRLNIASNGKRMLMEIMGEYYEQYVRKFAKCDDDIKYLEKEFSSVKII